MYVTYIYKLTEKYDHIFGDKFQRVDRLIYMYVSNELMVDKVVLLPYL
jgi:hypothetical protein